MNYGEIIKKVRKERGLTQKQLGERLGISQAAIGQFESNKANPKIDTIQKIADALNVSLNDLIPDVFEQKTQEGHELRATDYSVIEVIANHKIFNDKERKEIFEKIEHYRDILIKMNDRDQLFEYSNKTHDELENTLLKMLLNKKNCDISNVIIIISCFLSLNANAQDSIVEILIEHCYPDKDLKYCSDNPPQE